jgi:hypothetical protein
MMSVKLPAESVSQVPSAAKLCEKNDSNALTVRHGIALILKECIFIIFGRGYVVRCSRVVPWG